MLDLTMQMCNDSHNTHNFVGEPPTHEKNFSMSEISVRQKRINALVLEGIKYGIGK